MPAEWDVRHWPRCDFHVFLSHCAEDREKLILPVRARIEAKHVVSWIDRHEYPPGRDPFEILREELLRCRHIVYFVTESMLRQARGWTAVERGYAELAQRVLSDGPLELCHVEIPLIFVARDHPTLMRSIWQPLLPKAVFYPGKPRSSRERIEWAAEVIAKFVRHEEQWGLDIGTRIEADSALANRFENDPNLFDRVVGASPPPIGL
jgi:hypothetical protein